MPEKVGVSDLMAKDSEDASLQRYKEQVAEHRSSSTPLTRLEPQPLLAAHARSVRLDSPGWVEQAGVGQGWRKSCK